MTTDSVGEGRSPLRGAEADFAGDGVDFDAASAGANASAERMLAFFFDEHGNIRFDFAGDSVGGEMEIGVGRNSEVNGARGGLEIPIAGSSRVALDVDTAGSGLRFHVTGGAFDAHGTAGGRGFDASTGFCDLRRAGKRADADITLDVGDGYGAGGAVGAEITADILGANGTAE